MEVSQRRPVLNSNGRKIASVEENPDTKDLSVVPALNAPVQDFALLAVALKKQAEDKTVTLLFNAQAHVVRPEDSVTSLLVRAFRAERSGRAPMSHPAYLVNIRSGHNDDILQRKKVMMPGGNYLLADPNRAFEGSPLFPFLIEAITLAVAQDRRVGFIFNKRPLVLHAASNAEDVNKAVPKWQRTLQPDEDFIGLDGTSFRIARPRR